MPFSTLHKGHICTGGWPEFGIYCLNFGSYRESVSHLEKFKDERLTESRHYC